ncbi:SMI1/KNR4 family protein [Metabacillus sp. KIGAM252]|uniref:SMI1/KNR4 family protein n=1 Tax=Metabacillus flavus TaxID=2823519 RepID=A0ABS5LJ99_9BACI|nr:SMI1/KNR4 family protein [Metabacillus flavus]MBS2970797.1 SMI1/KNR4 family protein [Metabacillus flavus]
MPNFEDYKIYISSINDEENKTKKHVFFSLDEDVKEAEERLQMKFPGELKSLYKELGYGFLCNHDKTRRDRIMDPHSIADFILDEDEFIDEDVKELYPDHMLVFFEIGSGNYLTLDLRQEDSNGTCPIYYFDTKIADSIIDFMNEMDKEIDYYINF